MSTQLPPNTHAGHEADGCDCAPSGIGRRGFLGGAAGLTALGVVGGFGPLGQANVAYASTPSYTDNKTLVVISLRGGFDGLSAVIPIADPHYNTIRPTIGLQASQLQASSLDPTFAMHPALWSYLGPLWKQTNPVAQLALVHNVGQEDPTMSHFDAADLMEQAEPNEPDRTGWIDRAATATGPVGSDSFSETSIGPSTAPSSMLGSYPAIAMQSLSSFSLSGVSSTDFPKWAKALKAMQAGSSTLISDPAVNALSALSSVSAVASGKPMNNANYPGNSDLSTSLQGLAQLIRAGGVRIAAVDCNGASNRGWDMHVGLGGNTDTGSWMWQNLSSLGQSLAAFATDLGAEAMKNVTVVTLSEFGRRAYENDSGGLDHGHGNLSIVMGGGIKGGGQVLGKWQGLSTSGLDSNGNLQGTNDYRAVLAELLSTQLGFSSANITAVFPKTGKIDASNTANWVGLT